VAAEYVIGSDGTIASGVTHAVRSKNMNSSAFSCGESLPFRHDSGKSDVLTLSVPSGRKQVPVTADPPLHFAVRRRVVHCDDDVHP